MSDKKFKFNYSDVKKNISENQKLEKESFNNVRQSKKNNKVVFNDFNKTSEILLENNFDLSRQSKFNIDIGNDLRKSKSSRFDSTDYDKNGNYINKKLLNIKFTKFNDYTNESSNELVPLNSLDDNLANFYA
jgi:hypothetical protein